MKVIQGIKSYWQCFLDHFRKNVNDKANAINVGTSVAFKIEEDCIEEAQVDKISIQRRSLLTKLNSLEQRIKMFDEDFPEVYNKFLERIEELRNKYQKSLDEYNKSLETPILTLAINPEMDCKVISDISELESNINSFIDNDLKFHKFYKEFQKLCVKLNELYNASIRYPDSKRNASLQVERAREKLSKYIEKLGSSSLFHSDKYKQENLLDFILYADYLIFKCDFRNSDNPDLDKILANILVKSKFEGINYLAIFHNFMLEELEDLSKILDYLRDESQRLKLLGKIQILQRHDFEKSFYNRDFWGKIVQIEDEILTSLKVLGYGKEIARISILSRFDSGINEKEIFVSVKSSSCLALSIIFYETQNINAEIALNFISSLNDDITYKEMFFILLVFDLVDVVMSAKNISKSFLKNINEQNKIYCYTKDKVLNKKRDLLKLSETEDYEYVKIFSASSYDIPRFKEVLEQGSFSFIISNNAIYLNSFYFKELDNVMKSLKDRIY